MTKICPTFSTEAFLRNTPLFKSCSAAFFTTMDQQSQLLSLAKGQVLFVNGDPAERFYLIKSGWIKLFRETLDGAQAVVDILPERQIFGENASFNNDLYTYSAESAESSEVLSLPLAALKNELSKTPEFAMNMLRALTQKTGTQDKDIEHRTLQNAPQRIGCFLLRLTNQSDQGPVTLHLPYDKTLIAARLGIQPETFSRALSKLKEETGLKITGATIEIPCLSALSDYTCMACSSQFPCKDLSTTPSQQNLIN
jgi:CRP-like cAMP-binding protein